MSSNHCPTYHSSRITPLPLRNPATRQDCRWEADLSGRILRWACTCAASSNESICAGRFRRAWELGLSECPLKRSGAEVGSEKSKHSVRYSSKLKQSMPGVWLRKLLAQPTYCCQSVRMRSKERSRPPALCRTPGERDMIAAVRGKSRIRGPHKSQRH
jgi:hypothetical protein